MLVDALGLQGSLQAGDCGRLPVTEPALECLSFPIRLEAHIQLCFWQGVSLQLPGQTCLLFPVRSGELDTLSKGGNREPGPAVAHPPSRRGCRPRSLAPCLSLWLCAFPLPLRVSLSSHLPSLPAPSLAVSLCLSVILSCL